MHAETQALRSPLLARIRESDVHLAEVGGGCALWAEREWVASLLRANEDSVLSKG